MQRIQNPVWKNVLKRHRKLYTEYSPTNVCEFVSECFYYKIQIIRNKRVKFIKEWKESGIILIIQLGRRLFQLRFRSGKKCKELNRRNIFANATIYF